MKPATRLTMFAIVVLAAILLWSTLAAQKAKCDVCVSYRTHGTARTHPPRRKRRRPSPGPDHRLRADRARDGRVDRVSTTCHRRACGLHRRDTDNGCSLTTRPRAAKSVPERALVSPARPGPM